MIKINILSPSCNSLNTEDNGANVHGDELVARSWVSELDQRTNIEVKLNGIGEYDHSISFSPLISPQDKSKHRILYLQNVFPKPYWPGTVEMFHQVKHNYDNFIFPSYGLQEACSEKDGLVCQFAANTKIYYPDYINEEHPIVFVGNNIRDNQTTNDYILSTEPYGLEIYGNPQGWNHTSCKGKVSIDRERELYSSAKICLNAHLQEHLDYGSFNFRIFSILACGGYIISDRSDLLEQEFGGCMSFAYNKQDLIDQIQYVLKYPECTIPFREYGRNHILNKHTFKHRIDDLLNWLGII